MENNRHIIILEQEKLKHQKTKTELEKLKKDFENNLKDQWNDYVKDTAIKDILDDKMMKSDQKIVEIKKLMEGKQVAKDPGHAVDDKELAKIAAQNSALIEDKELLKQQLIEEKEKYEEEISQWKNKYETEHARAVMLAVGTPLIVPSPPPRRRGGNTTNPFL